MSPEVDSSDNPTAAEKRLWQGLLEECGRGGRRDSGSHVGLVGHITRERTREPLRQCLSRHGDGCSQRDDAVDQWKGQILSRLRGFPPASLVASAGVSTVGLAVYSNTHYEGAVSALSGCIS
mgnify:CR=1 FL=1